jgi:anti-sigma-K factor RskA
MKRMRIMKTISDDDLILYHYRDGLDAERLAQIERALIASADLRERLASIRHALACVDAAPAPAPAAGFEDRLWSALAPRLRASAPPKRRGLRDMLAAVHAWLTPPRLAFAAACALALAVGIGFYAGRRSAPPAPAIAASGSDAAGARVLDAYVAAHLRATEGVLMTASNSDSSALLDGNRELAASLVESNRLYAAAAARAGNTQLADFLRQLEPILISLANPPAGSTIQSSEGLRDYLRSTDLMFQVRATEARLDRAGAHRT